jgi:hypothetical protein
MRMFSEAEEKLARAEGLGEELAAGWEAFQFIVLVADHYSQQASGWFATWMSVLPPACEGRDCIGLAPSPRPEPAGPVEIPALTAVADDDAAAGLAGIAAVLRKRLQETASAARGAGDARACAHAADAAAEIYDLLALDA